MPTIPTTTYCTVRQVYESIQFYHDIVNEATGTGNSVLTVFQLGTAATPNRKVVQYTEAIYLAGVLKVRDTDYTIDYDLGQVTFTSAPGAVAITADYWWADVPSSVVGKYIVRVEDEIDRSIGRTFLANQNASEYLDGWASADIPFNQYVGSDFLSISERYKPLDQSYRTDKAFFTSNYPILNVNGVSTDVDVDAHYEESNSDANSAFGGANWIAQSFVAGGSNSVVKARAYLKYNTGTSAAITVAVYANSAGKPTGSALASGTIAAFTDSNYAWRDVDFSVPLQLTSGTTYHLVLSAASAGTAAFYWATDSTSPTYTDGAVNTSTNSGGAWTTDTTKDAIFSIYAGTVVASTDYLVYKPTGVIAFTTAGGKKNTKGLQNVYVSYTYGYANVPMTVENLAAKQAAVYLMQTYIFGDPSQDLDTRTSKIRQLQQDVDRLYTVMGRKLQMYLV